MARVVAALTLSFQRYIPTFKLILGCMFATLKSPEGPDPTVHVEDVKTSIVDEGVDTCIYEIKPSKIA